MLNGIRRNACELLFCFTETEVAEMLGVKLATLHKWMSEREFKETLEELEKNQVRSLARLARQASLVSSAYLCRAINDQCKIDPKVLLEIIKASGAYEVRGDSGDSALAEVVKAISECR